MVDIQRKGEALEVKLSTIHDPLGYLFNVLRKQVAVLLTISTSFKPSIKTIYQDNQKSIEDIRHNLELAWENLQEAVLAINTSSGEYLSQNGEELQDIMVKATGASQECLSLFDQLAKQYKLPANEPLLFSKLGTVLYE